MILKKDSGDEQKFCTTLMEKTVGGIGILNSDLFSDQFFLQCVDWRIRRIRQNTLGVFSKYVLFSLRAFSLCNKIFYCTRRLLLVKQTTMHRSDLHSHLRKQILLAHSSTTMKYIWRILGMGLNNFVANFCSSYLHSRSPCR
jgi:hypothetical protein